MKRCNKCGDVKPLAEYHRKGTGRDYLCKSCRNPLQSARRKKTVAEMPRVKQFVCKVCFNLPHRVEGAVCSCGLRRAA